MKGKGKAISDLAIALLCVPSGHNLSTQVGSTRVFLVGLCSLRGWETCSWRLSESITFATSLPCCKPIALLIDKFVAGELDKDADGEVTAVYRAGDNRLLAPDQMRVGNEIVDRVRAGMAERATKEEAWQDGHIS